MKESSINTQLSELLARANATGQRRLLVLSGTKDWVCETLFTLPLSEYLDNSVVISDAELAGKTAVSHQHVAQLLGQETRCVVYDAFAGLNPDAMGIAAGLVVGGGLLILLTPELDDWVNYNDPDYQRLLIHPFEIEQLSKLFLKRFAESIGRAEDCLLYSQTQGFHLTMSNEKTDTQATPLAQLAEATDDYCITFDQQQAVTAIVKVVTGHRCRPLVMTADRGRGKSSALGIASAQLLREKPRSIIITAPHVDAVKSVFEHAAAILGVNITHQGQLNYEGGSLVFMPPDYVIAELPKADLLLVDEAAAIAIDGLGLMLERYSRIVFSSTVHGYEGTGRGFSLRFKPLLITKAPQSRSLELRQPVRWRLGDPVEAWLFDALLLNANFASDTELQLSTSNASTIEEVDRKQLLSNDHELTQLFSLLVLAHYQTTPADLRNLLDGPNIHVWVVRHGRTIVATALVADEGGIDTQLSDQIWKGERRLRGHLIAQSLAVHVGLELAPQLQYQRIMRIAVHPQLQRQGIGERLLLAIEKKAKQKNVDIIGSSFSATQDVLAFWHNSGFVSARLGLSKDTCSGSHSVMVLKAFNLPGEVIVETARFRFLEQFPHFLLTTFSELDPIIVAELMLGNDYYDTIILDEQDWLDITAFAEGQRLFEVCRVPLWKLVCSFMGQLEVRQWLSDDQRDLLVYCLLQNRSMSWIAKTLVLTGKKQLIIALREAIKVLSQQQTFLRSTLLH